MEILESALKSNWSAHSRVDAAAKGGAGAAVRDESFSALLQLLRSEGAHSRVDDAAKGGAGAAVWDESFSACLQLLRSEELQGQEVLDAAAVASFARHFLAGFKALFVCSAEVAAKMLERLAGPGGDLDMFVKVLSLDAARAVATEDDMDVDGDAARAAATEDYMDVDGRPAPGARHRQEGSGRSCAPAGSVMALFPSSGAKRKRPCCGGGGEGDTVQPQKRRLLAWTRSHQRLPSGFGRRQRLPSSFGRVSSAPREPPRRARTVALAMSRIRRRMGNPTTTRHRPQPSLGQHFSRITL